MKQVIAGLILSLPLSLLAQVPKEIVVEHFTNSECGICASKNPLLYDNLNNYPEIHHITIHPSAPYAFCALSQNNPAENDARTNYYGIYGATPRLVIQGEIASPGISYSSALLFEPYFDAISPISIRQEQTIFDDYSYTSTVIIKTVAAHSYTELAMFGALTEDTVFYSGGNGEDEHHDVFRKAFTETSGQIVTIPAGVGDSIIITNTVVLDEDWNYNRLAGLVILQEVENKNVVQSSYSHDIKDSTLISNPVEDYENTESVILLPNPTSGNIITLNTKDAITGQLLLTTLTGQLIKNEQITTNYPIEIGNLPAGSYLVTFIGENQSFNKILIKQ